MFKAGLDILCYNFMPVVDWTRTDLEFEYNDGSNALKFDFDAFAAFDIFLMRRSNAQKDYTERQLERYNLNLPSPEAKLGVHFSFYTLRYGRIVLNFDRFSEELIVFNMAFPEIRERLKLKLLK